MKPDAIRITITACKIIRSEEPGTCNMLEDLAETQTIVEADFSNGIAFENWKKCIQQFQATAHMLHVKIIK